MSSLARSGHLPKVSQDLLNVQKIPHVPGAQGASLHVDGLMDDQIAITSEAFAADGTRVRFLPRVTRQMIEKARLVGEDLPALRTRQPLPSMVSPMVSEIGPADEYFGALRALVILLRGRPFLGRFVRPRRRLWLRTIFGDLGLGVGRDFPFV